SSFQLNWPCLVCVGSILGIWFSYLCLCFLLRQIVNFNNTTNKRASSGHFREMFFFDERREQPCSDKTIGQRHWIDSSAPSEPQTQKRGVRLKSGKTLASASVIRAIFLPH